MNDYSSWADFNNDGYIDVYVGGYENTSGTMTFQELVLGYRPVSMPKATVPRRRAPPSCTDSSSDSRDEDGARRRETID